MIDMECLICGEDVKTRDVKVAVAFDREHAECLAAAKARHRGGAMNLPDENDVLRLAADDFEREADALARYPLGSAEYVRGIRACVQALRERADCPTPPAKPATEEAYQRGLAEGEARVRARVAAVCGCDSTGCPCGGDRASVPTRDLRAALDADAAETTGGGA